MTTQAFRQLQGADTFAASYGYLNLSDLALLAGHEGPAEPAFKYAYMIWNDTALNLVKQRNANNDAWYAIGKLGVANWGNLQTSGGTMTGGINMGGQTITNLGLGTGQAAARQQELDAKAPLVAPQFTGDATVNQDPFGNNSLIRRVWAESRYFLKAGGTLTGPITLFADGSANLHPVSIQQLKTYVAFNPSSGHRHTGGDARRVLAIDLDSQGFADGTKLVANGAGVCRWSSNVSVVWFTTPILLVDSDPAPLTFTDSNVAGSVSSSASVAIIAIQAFDANVIRLRADGDGTDTSAMDLTVNTGFGIPGRLWFVNLSALKVFEWRKVSGPGTHIIIKLMGYAQI